MSEIVVSYERSTASQAQIVAKSLRSLGYEVWLDDELPVHRAFDGVIEEHLRLAKAVVVIWSVAAATSDWVKSEANRGREDRKLVQIRVDSAKLPMPFDQIQCANLEGWTGDPNALSWQKVLASVADLTGGARVSGRKTEAPIVRKSSLCVLPFVNMSGDAEQEYFSDGITEDIITDLSKVSALFVIARNTAFTFKAKSVDVPQVARQLKVSHVLEGSVRKSGGRVRITAQLNDGATGGQVWAERYDRDLTDIFALQDEISGAIVNALKLKLLPGEKTSMERRGTDSVEAYDLYLRGTHPAFGLEQQLARIASLEAATRLAPDYADAWGALAIARAKWREERPYAERADIATVVSREAERALELDPRNLNALAAQFQLLPWFGRFVDAATLTTRMEAIAGASADTGARHVCNLWCARHLVSVGRMREAIEATERAYETDPLDPDVANLRGRNLCYGGRLTEGLQILKETVSRWPDHHFAVANLVHWSAYTRDWATVDSMLAPERLARFPLREYAASIPSTVSLMRSTSAESRRQPIEAARRRFETSGRAELGQLQLAAKMGFPDEAHVIAINARFGSVGNEHDRVGFHAYTTKDLFSAMSPEFRRDPRFVVLCARLGLVEYWLTTQHWPDCVDEVAPYYDFKAECQKVAAGPPLSPANETASPASAI